ncbi:MAG: DUF1579 domain-containing protein [Candidatus Hydrogenedentes bacterium]|nr:DUF1579 domain-containing protein [Candidatus Hydrogenedentota bacterium]
MPPPQKEHEWLQQLVGEWTSEGEAYPPGMDEPIKFTGSETTKSIGGFWTISEGRSNMPGMPGEMVGVLTLGYDPAAKHYVGTWVDSMGSHMWTYEGTMDESGKKLTLDTTGPCPMKGGAMTPFREVIEITGENEKTFASYMEGDKAGEWVKIVSFKYTRK